MLSDPVLKTERSAKDQSVGIITLDPEMDCRLSINGPVTLIKRRGALVPADSSKGLPKYSPGGRQVLSAIHAHTVQIGFKEIQIGGKFISYRVACQQDMKAAEDLLIGAIRSSFNGT